MVVAADTASALSASGTVRYGNACSTCGEEEDEDRDCYCFICHRPCADADDIGSSFVSPHPREDNRYRCTPCFLCNDCNVNINGRAVCYDCLAVEEIEIVPDQLRLQMLCPTKFRIASTSTPSTSTAS